MRRNLWGSNYNKIRMENLEAMLM
uniref:Uncharacterized protein n=1 Tax=Rhizophora mucronata TaxID=61149 RepID=A0A2P2Q2D1_RHIMU